MVTPPQEREGRADAPGVPHSLEVAASAGSSLLMFLGTELGLSSALHFGKLVYMRRGVQAWSFLNNTRRSCCLLRGKKKPKFFLLLKRIQQYRAENLGLHLSLQHCFLFLLSDKETPKFLTLTEELWYRCW